MPNVVYSNNFDGLTAGTLPAGWANLIGNWIVEANHPVSGTQTLGNSPQNDGDVIIFAGGAVLGDCKFALDYINLGENQGYGLYLRLDDTGANGYLMNLAQSSGSYFVSLLKRSGNAFSGIGTPGSASGTPVVGDTVHVEFIIVGSTLEGRVWANGATKPSSPTCSATDAVFATGRAGVRYGQASNLGTQGFDNAVITDLKALTAGSASAGSVSSSTAAATATEATGGTGPYSKQWFQSTTSGSLGSAVSGQTSLTLAATGLTASTDYYFTCQYTDADTNVISSNQVHVTTTSSGSSLAPGTATAGSVTTTTAGATATDATGGTPTYTKQWFISTTSGALGSAISGQTSLTLAATGLTQNTDYYFTLKWTDSASNNVTSNQIHMKTAQVLTAGVASAGSVTNTTVSATATEATGGTGPYTKQWFLSTSSGSLGSAISGQTSLSCTATGLTASTAYFLTCRFTDSASATVDSNQISETTNSSSGVRIAVDSASIKWSPYNWDLLAIADFGVSVRSKQTTCCGAYLEFNVTGTANIALALDSTTLASGFTSNTPLLEWSIGDGASQRAQLTIGASSISLATGLTTGSTYNVRVWVLGTNELIGTRWGSSSTVSPTNVVRIQGILLDSGGSASAPSVFTDNAVFFGDSITETYRANFDRNPTPPFDHGRSYAWFVGKAFKLEYSVIGFGSLGWEQAGSGGVPAFPSSWNLHTNGRTRTFTPDAKYVFNMLGTNGTTTASDVSTWLPLARTAFPNAWIFLVAPTSGQGAGAIQTGMANYQVAHPTDRKVAYLDYTDRIPTTGMWQPGTPSFETSDGVHPYEFMNGYIGAAVAQTAQAVMDGALAPTTTKTVTDVLKDSTGAVVSNASGLKALWWDQSDPSKLRIPTTFVTFSTDISGNFSITVNSSLPSGGVGTLGVSNSDGTSTQSDVKAFFAPHQVT